MMSLVCRNSLDRVQIQMLRLTLTLFTIVMTIELRAASSAGHCRPAWFEASLNHNSDQQPDPFVLRTAEGYVQKPASKLHQPLRFCRCSDGTIHSHEEESCADVLSSLQTRLNHRTVSSIPVVIQHSELRRLHEIAALQLRLGRQALKWLASGDRGEFLKNLQQEFDLPKTAIERLNQMHVNLSKFSGKDLLFFRPELANYPYLVGIHALDLRNGMSESESIDFSFWPHSTHKFEQNQNALSRLQQAAEVHNIPAAWTQHETTTIQIMERWITALKSSASHWTGIEGDLIAVHYDLGKHHEKLVSALRESKIPIVDIRNIVQSDDARMYWRDSNGGQIRPVSSVIPLIDEAELLNISKNSETHYYQQFVDNLNLGARLGMNLRPGIWYDYIFDSDSDIVGIHLDDQAKPRLYRGVIEAHVRSDLRLNFEEAVVKRKIFLSGFGTSIFRHPLITEALSQLGNYVACRELNRSNPSHCESMAGFGNTPNPEYLLRDARVDIIGQDGKLMRYDFAELVPETRAAAQRVLSSQKQISVIRIKPRRQVLTALSPLDIGNGSKALVRRAASLRYFVLAGLEDDPDILGANTTAELAHQFSDETGHGHPGAIIAPVLVEAKAHGIQQ